ncbi:MAG: homocysteine S-methyltransferase family protein [Chthonomonadales bacterium]|nr:homocysteine S-methyltransferase family protein [Chthonomonadales bacterium]
MNETIAELMTGGVVVTDGAWGTQLQQRGLPIGEAPEPWNLAHPERVAEVARAYVAAGSRVILTNTFGANRIVLARHGLAERAADLCRAGVAISREAAAGRARIFASMGPTCKLVGMDEGETDEVAEAFVEQARAFADAGADGVVVETMSDLEEARLAVRAAVDVGLPVVACMVFDTGREKDRTMMGGTPEQAVEALTAAGAAAVGANCGVGPRAMLPVCRRMKAVTDLPLWFKPNAGMPELENGQAVYRMSPREFAIEVVELARAGAAFVGGCCGTTPEFIGALALELGKEYA